MKSSIIISPLLLASLVAAVDFFKVKTTYEDVDYYLQYNAESNLLQLTTNEGTEFDLNEFFNLILADDPTKVVSNDDNGTLFLLDHDGEATYPVWGHEEGCCISYAEPLFACAFDESASTFGLTTNIEGLPGVDYHFCFPVLELAIFNDEPAQEISTGEVQTSESIIFEDEETPYPIIEEEEESSFEQITNTFTEEVVITETICDSSSSCSEFVTTITYCESDTICEPSTTIRSTTISSYCPSSTTPEVVVTTAADDTIAAYTGAVTVVVTVCDESTTCTTYNSVVKGTDTPTFRTARVSPKEEDTTSTITQNVYITQTPAPQELSNNANGMKSQYTSIIVGVFIVFLSLFA